MYKFYFYCPNCGKEDVVDILPFGTVGNIRDGYGTPIHHYECSECHNLDAGFMRFNSSNGTYELSEDEQKPYFKHVIGIYQNIRGIREI